MSKTVLITGAYGFIGSHTAKVFKQAGYRVIGLDHEYTLSHCEHNIKKYIDISRMFDFVDQGSFCVSYYKPDAIVHCAGHSLVGPSIANPGRYYRNNVCNLNSFFNALTELYKIKCTMVFSSSAAVYGSNNTIPIIETDRKDPVSPYGRSKLMGEQIIHDHCVANGHRAIALRYFNATGCDIDGELGNTKDDTHLVPKVATAALSGKQLVINGNDYNTPDGTCIRDYLHVTDIAQAHLAAVEMALEYEDGYFEEFNLGTGKGHSNLEIANAFVQHTNAPLSWVFGPRQEGDPDELVADPLKFVKATGWMPEHSELETIVKTTYDYMKKTYYTN